MKKIHKNIGITFGDLIGRQSVRATFKLPQHIIDLLSVLSGQLGIKQKSLFDQLAANDSILCQIAKEARSYSAVDGNRRQKTFVISKSSLQSLNAVSEREEISRDLLVEISVYRLMPIIKNELEKHEKRKDVLLAMKSYIQQGNELVKKSKELLGNDDSVFQMVKEQADLAKKNFSAVKTMVEKGRPMEKW